jgi:outer membrane protein assembly factor BamE (lipoprotein component of BamABCDE complex)
MKYKLLAAVFVSLLIGCGTVGKQFDSSKVKDISKGATTKSQILEMFGLPFKEGFQDGLVTWTYQFDSYSSIGSNQYKDLVILFDSRDVVKSYRYTSTGADNY